MRRTFALILAFFMAVSILSGCVKQGLPPPKEAPSGTTLTVHYHRYQGDYESWDLWVWPFGTDGTGHKFTGEDDYGVTATITYTEKYDKLGFIVRKGGDSWTAKDIAKDRFVDVKNGRAEIWVVEGEEAFATSKEAASVDPKIKAAYLDSKRTVYATLSHDLTLSGSSTEGFRFHPPLQIEAVKDGRQTDAGLIGYEFLSGNKEIRFVLAPGLLGFPASTADGRAEVYISGPFNGWSNTVDGGFTGFPEWKMTWSGVRLRYELTAPVGTDKGRVPLSGSEFKFTWAKSGGQEWYPSANIPITVNTGEGTKEILITLAEDADITRDYTLQHETLEKALVLKRGVLDDPTFVYTGNDLGHTYSSSGTRFRLWAPTAAGVEVLLYDGPEGGTPKAHPLRADQGGTWATEVPGNWEGKYYTYRLTSGTAKLEVMDPYATGAGINGNRALVFDLSETNPPGWESHSRPPFNQVTEAVLYEIHVRDLSTHANSGIKQKGKFLGFTETGTTGPGGVTTGLDHLKEMGVTHIHLLPSFDYATVDEKRSDQYNWGYDPKNYNVPEGSYASDPNGTARNREFKQMVKALHDNGLRVVMDVVYNHTSVGASPFEAIAPHYYYRYDAEGRMSNGSGTGNETASERPMVRKFIVDSVRFWATEYKVDGFRFDLMALHDVDTIKAVRAALNEIDPSIIVYGEPWTGGSSPLEPGRRLQKGNQKGLGIAVFNDHLRNAIKGDNDGIQKGFATGAGLQITTIQRGVVGAIDFDQWVSDFALHPTESVNYASSHDNLTLWDKIAHSNKTDSEADRIRMDLLSQAIVFTSQGLPFMQGGEEMLRTKGGNHNSYNQPDSVNQLDWSRKLKYEQIFAYYKGLIALRKAHPAFRLATASQVKSHLALLEGLAPNTVTFLLTENAGGDPWRNILVIYNPNKEDVRIALPAGTWSVAARDLQIGGLSETATDRVQVPRISMMVLYQE